MYSHFNTLEAELTNGLCSKALFVSRLNTILCCIVLYAVHMSRTKCVLISPAFNSEEIRYNSEEYSSVNYASLLNAFYGRGIYVPL